MANTFQAVRGMTDCLPQETPVWAGVEAMLRDTLTAYGYSEIRLPLVERTELFCRSIGEVTDIVEKEMYTFPDRGGDSLTLRPEGTAGCVRAGIEHNLLYNQIQRLWYLGPMFRYERPQKGRYRQFHQCGAEAFGMAGPDVDAELIALTARCWRRLGLEDVSLQINSLGSTQARAAYRERLVAYLEQHQDALDEDSRRRLHGNPLRILDTKDPQTLAVVAGAPALLDHLDAESQRHFERLQELLGALGVTYVVNSRLVRGLDYYNRTVFEWVTDRLGAQGTVCAGGRYDGLVEQLGGRATPAVGFAIGLERLIALVADGGRVTAAGVPHVYLATAGDLAERSGLVLAERLRNALPNLRLQMNGGGGGFKTQLKRADRSGARLAIILGADEISQGWATVKFLRTDGEQVKLHPDDLAGFLSTHLDLAGTP